MSFYDVMVDIETTGTHPDENAIIQLAAVKFNLEEGTVDSASMFNRCLAIPPKRYWAEDTRQWWGQQKREILHDIYSRMEDPKTVLEAFQQWSNKDNDGAEPLRFWGKPISFDYTFVQSYFNQFEVMNPYHFRFGTDMNSFIRGLARDSRVPTFNVDFQGDAHNAIYDVLNQISAVFQAKDHYASAA